MVFGTDTWDVLDGHGAVLSMLVDCEALLGQIQTLLAALASGSDWVIYPLSHIITIYNENCPPDDGGGGGSPSGGDCDRDDRECRERILKFRFSGSKTVLNQFCEWIFFGYDCLVKVHTTFAVLA
ncbi:hypothetical protein RZS08_54275, partial [Arthrospira platensis SPKY1]|nr:hypothetical protein [Arthrospira platensis SPKY1]